MPQEARPTKTFDVIVLGVGAMGSAACSELARRGVSVLGIDRSTIPNPWGSSGGQTRMIRMAYFEHPDFVPLLRRSYELWDDLEVRNDLASGTLFHRTGLLYLGREDEELIAGVLRSAHEYSLDVQRVSHQDVDRHGPFVTPEHFTALFEPDAGFVMAEESIRVWAAEARRHGAVLREYEQVLSWATSARDSASVEVVTNRGRYQGGHLLLTAGAWAPELLDGIEGLESKSPHLPLRVSRQVAGWVEPPDPEPFRLGNFPCWAIQEDDPAVDGLYYGFPILPTDHFPARDGEHGLKVARHWQGLTTTADTLDRNTTEADQEDFLPALRRYLPTAQGPTQACKACLYTNTPDEIFLVDRHPRQPNLTVATGFSGHGFKFASAMGEVLADLVLGKETTTEVQFLRLHSQS